MPTYKYTPRRSLNNGIPKSTEEQPKNENLEIKEESSKEPQVMVENKPEPPVLNKTNEPKVFTRPVQPIQPPVEKTQPQIPVTETKKIEKDEPPVTVIFNKETKIENKMDDYFSMEPFEEEVKQECPAPVVKKAKAEKVKKSKTKKKTIKFSKKLLKPILGVIVVATIIFIVLKLLSGVVTTTENKFTITNEHLKNRVVQGITPGDLIDIENSLPLQITSKDLVINDYSEKPEREILLWDYTNTNLNKITIKADDKVILENTVLKKKPIAIKIPAECKLEISISEKVNADYMSYAMQVENNTYFNKMSVSRGNIVYFTNPLAEDKEQ